MDFSEIIKDLRKEKGLTQQELAYELNLSQSAIAKLEKKLREPTGSTLLAYAKFFNVSLDYLLDRKDNFRIPQFSAIAMTSEEKNLLYGFRKLDAIQRETFLIQLNALVKNSIKI